MDMFGEMNRIERSAGVIAPEELSEPPLVEMMRYWETKRAGRDLPCRADIDPAELVPFLRRIFMIRVGREPLSFIYSLVGDDNIEAHGRNFTGWKVRDLDQISAGYGATMHDFYTRFLHHPSVRAARGEMSFVDRGFCNFESIYLPLAAQDGSVSHIMGAATYRLTRAN